MKPKIMLMIAALMGLSAFTSATAADGTFGDVLKLRQANIVLFSMADTADSYVPSGSASGKASSMLGLSYSGEGRVFMVEVRLSEKDDRFLADVALVPGRGDRGTEARTFQLDLTDLKPLQLELARDEATGRRYALQVTPSIDVIDQRTRPFDPARLRLELFYFSSGPVIVNDERYVGRMGAGGGELAWLELPGIGQVEFSLKRFRGAEALGALYEGTIGIKLEDGQRIQIDGVTNGVHNQVIPGGPYTVWVRWTPSELSFEQQVEQTLSKFEGMQRQNELPPDVTPEQIESIRRGIRRGSLMGSGVMGIPQKDRL